MPSSNPIDEIRILAPTGVCGSGFSEESFETALAQSPHVIGCDAGSTDPGPEYLGTGRTAFPVEAIARDLRLMLRGARRLGVPLLLGSCGPAGADAQVDLVRRLVLGIAREEKLSFELATILAEQPKEYLLQRLPSGQLQPDATVTRQITGTSQDQIAHAGESHEGLAAPAKGLAQAPHLGQTARHECCAGIHTQAQPIANARGYGQNILDRTANFNADQIGAVIQPQRRLM